MIQYIITINSKVKGYRVVLCMLWTFCEQWNENLTLKHFLPFMVLGETNLKTPKPIIFSVPRKE